MKTALPLLFLWIFYACNSEKQKIQNDVPILSISESFNQGKSTTPKHYFYGILSEIIEIDLLHREIEMLDEQNGDQSHIDSRIDSCQIRIRRTKKTLKYYSEKKWSHHSEFQSLTRQWLKQMDVVLEKLKPLSNPFSRADSSWTQRDYQLFDFYSTALDSLTVIDHKWVNFQYDYANANSFKLDTGSIIDVTELAKKDLLKSQ